MLEKISKKVGLNIDYFLKNGFWVGLRYAFLALSGLLLSVSFTHLSNKEFLGQYQFILSFLSFLSLFALPGLNLAALKAVTQSKEAAIIKAVRLSFLSGIIATPILAGWGIYEILFNSQIILGWSFVLAGVIFPFFNAPNTWYVYFEGKSLFKEVSLRMIGMNIITTLALILGLLLHVNIIIVLLIYLLSNLILHWIFYFEVVGRINNLVPDEQNELDIKYGIYVSVQKFVYGFYNNIPPLAITFVFGFEFTAIYYITYYVIGTISALLSALSSVYMPLLFKNIKLAYGRIIVQNLILGIVFLFAFIIFLKFIFIYIYGNSYYESLKLGYAISGLLILMPIRIFLVNYFTTQKKNLLIIVSFIFSNAAAFSLFLLTKSAGFITSASLYVYSLQFLTILPLLISYFLTASRKNDSIRSEITFG